MEIEQVKKYLQTFLDTILIPKISNQGDEIKLTVHDVLLGTYHPPILHVFIDSDPKVKTKTWYTPHRIDIKVNREIENFLRMLSIQNNIKVHWDKRPLLKKDKKYSKNV